jgi:hypothetical protein
MDTERTGDGTMAIHWGNEQGTTHEGRVLEYPVYHAQACSSDYEPVYARVILDGGVTHDVSVGTVSYASRWGGYATVDATDKAKAEMAAHEARRTAIFAEQDAAEKAVNRFYRIEKGATVRFVKGRKVKKGTVLPVAWSGKRYDEMRVGVRVGGEMVFVAADNCVREYTDTEREQLDRAWDRWVKAQAAAEDLIEHEYNVQGGYDPKQHEHRWYQYQKAIGRWVKDWPPTDHDHRDEMIERIKALRTIEHVPNAHEAAPVAV